ncbi:hypothetical protein COW36_24870 [bacterium (Candidatus Blackallbacteria) CG17_big_fil_post_rev_8_21_14_2_50_48_46]|uniref:Uncharacterized protein n=1 Tax=bacterium (Candidatus Blackallbacteria) CG17_big_fil_post_rev_8_21_14_2_50_48_46 TaxID=2014261 RepID=A0A2M7FXT9_9BACT|nr:MAG: hypothetical protein COW64_19810 [bacterium (Candidatus Blackallbacteria) CG18_big_fil_WC_8_21_14_2_50_49_26]PIW13902.1 MAG: hypothetical protein COW36_24870 [bacterium (Candidatus Blackallbacteria) CG17_big_fil_post_rev_8_21_14_2_50_48_46]PIW45128.1 MAG: hypothetical protein COW20_22500 [bacterium (Candidatus Blackallbacteria) CG13_big_fil_rev_8_21_14_2_50_49_14]
MDNNQNPPNKPPFPRQGPPPQPGRPPQRTGQTGRLPNLGKPVPPPGTSPSRSSLESTDSVQVSGQAGPVRKEPPPVVAPRKLEDPFLSPGASSVAKLEDGARIVRYPHPQKLGKLVKDAKAIMGGDSSRFFGQGEQGWVIGNGIAKIARDGTSVTYYPDELADLVKDLLGPDSETI